ncbi:PIN domain-containing protein [soil metagenome]
MMSTNRIFIDTNVLLYLISSDSEKATIASRVLVKAPTISVQILNEFVAVARRKHKKSWDIVLAITQAVAAECKIVPLTLEVHERAVGLARYSGISIYDACVIAAAECSACDVLYTEDLNPGQRFGSVTVRNPFAER